MVTFKQVFTHLLLCFSVIIFTLQVFKLKYLFKTNYFDLLIFNQPQEW